MSFTEARQMTEQHQTDPPPVVLGRILLYVHDIEAVAKFYALHFGFRIHREAGDRVVELESSSGAGNNIMLHSLGRGRKSGQTIAKLVFDVPDVEAFCARAAELGLKFGAIHKGDGYIAPMPKTRRVIPFPYQAAPSATTFPDRTATNLARLVGLKSV